MPTTTNHLLHAYQDTQHTHTTHYWTHQTLHPTVQDSVNAVVGCRAVNTEHCTVQVKLEMGGMTGRRYDPLLSTDPDCTALCTVQSILVDLSLGICQNTPSISHHHSREIQPLLTQIT